MVKFVVSRFVGVWLAGFLGVCSLALSAQTPAASLLQGTVVDGSHKAVSGAVVHLTEAATFATSEAKSDATGAFSFSALKPGSYRAIAESATLHSAPVAVVVVAGEIPKPVELVIGNSTQNAADAMEFADNPNFTVAGVVDWTAVGGHGSDANLRTSEALARDTIALKSDSAERTAGSTEADKHRLAGEAAEKRSDPLAAVHEYEQAVRLDPSEDNYFHWSSELLLHRAVWQAQQVFQKAAEAYPKSLRIQTGLGTALFASAHYDDAAAKFCGASDLNPAATEPYVLLGKIALAAPNPLACVEQKLARFAKEQPDNSVANYLYAMALLKRQQTSGDAAVLDQVQALLTKAVALDAKCADGYLQLGILSTSHRKTEEAIGFYNKAIAANPELGDAHYRLAAAYDRIGEHAKAEQEYEVHRRIEKEQADAVESQRREVKQFLVVLDKEPAR